jgi:hypothetical protein
MSWEKTQDENDVSYICTEGELKGSTIYIRKQDEFKKNRFCSIVLRGNDNVILKELCKPIRDTCDNVRHVMDSPGLTTEVYTFLFHDNDDKSQIFLDCINRLSKICPLISQYQHEILISIGGLNAGEIKKNARMLSQAERTQTSLFSTLPAEVNIKIAGLSGNTDDRDEMKSKSETIARNHYDRPNTKPQKK